MNDNIVPIPLKNDESASEKDTELESLLSAYTEDMLSDNFLSEEAYMSLRRKKYTRYFMIPSSNPYEWLTGIEKTIHHLAKECHEKSEISSTEAIILLDKSDAIIQAFDEALNKVCATEKERASNTNECSEIETRVIERLNVCGVLSSNFTNKVSASRVAGGAYVGDWKALFIELYSLLENVCKAVDFAKEINGLRYAETLSFLFFATCITINGIQDSVV